MPTRDEPAPETRACLLESVRMGAKLLMQPGLTCVTKTRAILAGKVYGSCDSFDAVLFADDDQVWTPADAWRLLVMSMALQTAISGVYVTRQGDSPTPIAAVPLTDVDPRRWWPGSAPGLHLPAVLGGLGFAVVPVAMFRKHCDAVQWVTEESNRFRVKFPAVCWSGAMAYADTAIWSTDDMSWWYSYTQATGKHLHLAPVSIGHVARPLNRAREIWWPDVNSGFCGLDGATDRFDATRAPPIFSLTEN